MGLFVGDKQPEKLYLGTLVIDKVFLGTNLIYTEGGGGSTDPDVTILDTKIYSGFSDSNYITIPNIYTADMTSFSQKICFSVSSFSVSNQALIDTKNGETSIRLTITEEGYLHFRRSSTGEQTYDIDIIGSTVLDLNQFIYAMVEYDSAVGYTIKHSIDGQNWIIDGTSDIKTLPYIASSSALFYIGDNVASGYSLLGSIDIRKTEFKRNGTTVFNGATAVAGTDYNVVGSPTLFNPNALNISQVGLTTGITQVTTQKVYEAVSASDEIGLSTGLLSVTAPVNVYEHTSATESTGLETGLLSVTVEDL